jgi:hypothetical protein
MSSVLNRLKQMVGLRTFRNGYLPDGLAIGDLVALWRMGVVEDYGVVITKADYEKIQGANISFRKMVPIRRADGKLDFGSSARKVTDYQEEIRLITTAYDGRMHVGISEDERKRLETERDVLIKFIGDHAAKTSNTNVPR